MIYLRHVYIAPLHYGPLTLLFAEVYHKMSSKYDIHVSVCMSNHICQWVLIFMLLLQLEVLLVIKSQ